MYIPEILCQEDDLGWAIDIPDLIRSFLHFSDIELAEECLLLGECFRALDNYSDFDFKRVPNVYFLLDSYRSCLYAAASSRFVDFVLSREEAKGCPIQQSAP